MADPVEPDDGEEELDGLSPEEIKDAVKGEDPPPSKDVLSARDKLIRTIGDMRGPIGWEKMLDTAIGHMPAPAWAGANPEFTQSPNIDVNPKEAPIGRYRGGGYYKSIEDFLADWMMTDPYATHRINEAINQQITPDINDETGRPFTRGAALYLTEDPMMGKAYFGETPMGVQAGTRDIDQYARQFQMPDFERANRLGQDESLSKFVARMKELPDYMRERYLAEDQAAKLVRQEFGARR